jgi:cytochrome bd-type quinol oxidase subunit 1
MQYPVGYTIQNGVYVRDDWAKIIFSPVVWVRFPHMLLAAYVTGAFCVAATGASPHRRQLLVVQQVAAQRSMPIAVDDKTSTSFTANYLPLDGRLTATRVAQMPPPYPIDGSLRNIRQSRLGITRQVAPC